MLTFTEQVSSGSTYHTITSFAKIVNGNHQHIGCPSLIVSVILKNTKKRISPTFLRATANLCTNFSCRLCWIMRISDDLWVRTSIAWQNINCTRAIAITQSMFWPQGHRSCALFSINGMKSLCTDCCCSEKCLHLSAKIVSPRGSYKVLTVSAFLWPYPMETGKQGDNSQTLQVYDRKAHLVRTLPEVYFALCL